MTDALNLKALETVTFATTRFFSSSFYQWKKIYESYKGLIETYIRCREDCDDDEDETRYQVRTKMILYMTVISKRFPVTMKFN
jgi:hypothetical protein